MARADDKAAMEAMMSMEFDMDAESGDEGKSTPKTKSKSSSGKAKTDEVIKIKTEPGQRKRRKVKHQVQEQNAKGYTGESRSKNGGMNADDQLPEMNGERSRILANPSQSQNLQQLQRQLKAFHHHQLLVKHQKRKSSIRPGPRASLRRNRRRGRKVVRAH